MPHRLFLCLYNAFASKKISLFDFIKYFISTTLHVVEVIEPKFTLFNAPVAL